MAISKHLLFSVLFLVIGFLLASSEPADNRRPPSRPPSPRPPPPRRPPSPPPPRPQSPPPPRPSPPPPSPPPKPPGFDYFMLALQWPNSVCFATYMCKPPVPKQQYFTIHGLWPRKNYGGQPRDCDTDQKMTDAILDKKELKNDLLDYWPRLFTADDFTKSKRFWKEQWDKHGSCSSNTFSPEAYLQITIALAKKYGPLILKEMEQQGIKPDRSTLHDASKTLDAIKAATNTAAVISCSDISGKLQLDEIRLCVKADGKTLQDCKSNNPQGECSKGFIFPPPLSTTHSRFPSFVSSMLDVEEAVGI